MTFTVDSCIIIALANEFDSHYEKSAMLLVKREDSLVILITVMTEAISTYIRKFNKASRDIVDMLGKNLESPDFVNLFDQEFKKMILSRKRGDANFYRYVYSLVENHIKNKKYKHVVHTLQDHSYDLAVMIPGKINSLKRVKTTIYPDNVIMADRDQLESISPIKFPRGADRNNFFILCAYTRGRNLDYFTTDGRYYLKMIESLNVIRRDKFESIGLCPQYLTDSYVASLQ